MSFNSFCYYSHQTIPSKRWGYNLVAPTEISGICGCSTTAWIWLYDAHNAQHLGKQQHKEGEKRCFHQGSLKIVWCLGVPRFSLPAKPQALLKQEYLQRRKRCVVKFFARFMLKQAGAHHAPFLSGNIKSEF